MRKVFFSFDQDDVWRANQVRHCWASKDGYEITGFMDKANTQKLSGATDAEMKEWIKAQLAETFVTCVLIGDETHRSRWVKYGIEQSIKKGNGLLGVRIHNQKDSKGELSEAGKSPLQHKAKSKSNAAEALVGGGVAYGLARLLIPQLAVPAGLLATALMALDPKEDDYAIYDWEADDGYHNLGKWIEKAARQVGK